MIKLKKKKMDKIEKNGQIEKNCQNWTKIKKFHAKSTFWTKIRLLA